MLDRDTGLQKMVQLHSAQDELDLRDQESSSSSSNGSCSPVTTNFETSKYKDSNDSLSEKRARIYSPKCEKLSATTSAISTNFAIDDAATNVSSNVSTFKPFNLLQQPMLHAQFYSALQQSRSLNENMSTIGPLLLSSPSQLFSSQPDVRSTENLNANKVSETGRCENGSQPLADKQLLEIMHAHFARYYPLSFAMPPKLLQSLNTNRKPGTDLGRW